jgi:hypothetical protein
MAQHDFWTKLFSNLFIGTPRSLKNIFTSTSFQESNPPVCTDRKVRAGCSPDVDLTLGWTNFPAVGFGTLEVFVYWHWLHLCTALGRLVTWRYSKWPPGNDPHAGQQLRVSNASEWAVCLRDWNAQCQYSGRFFKFPVNFVTIAGTKHFLRGIIMISTILENCGIFVCSKFTYFSPSDLELNILLLKSRLVG